jgi:LysM repeat protein
MKIGGKFGSLAKDKRVQIGAAIAAGVGLVVLLTRKSTGATAGGGSDGSGSSINTGTLDSTGTDTYNAIGQIGQAWQDQWNQQFQDFSGQLTNINDKLGDLKQPVTSPSGGSTSGPSAIPVMALNPKLKTGQGFTIIKKGDTVASLAQKAGISVSLLKAFNPGDKLQHLGVGEAVRIRAVAGPAPAKIWR